MMRGTVRSIHARGYCLAESVNASVILYQDRVVEAGSSESVFNNPHNSYTWRPVDSLPHFAAA
jgi:ABC-type dipeptide/oligopeptide/nickel transport system ATPase component